MREKTTFVKIGLILLSLSLIFSLTACPSGDDARGTEAEITGVTVAGYFAADLPEPIPAYQWELGLGGLTADQTGNVFVDVLANLTNARIDVVGLSPGASVRFAIATGATMMPGDFSPDNVITLRAGLNEFLYIEVTSEDGRTVNYYRIRVQLMSGNAALSSVAIGPAGTTPTSTTNVGAPASSWNAIETSGSINLPTANASNALVTYTTPTGANSTVEIAFVSASAPNEEPVFGPSVARDFVDGDALFFRVTSENGETTNFFKIVIEQGRVATLSSVVIGGGEEAGMISLGTPAATWDVPVAARGLFQGSIRMDSALGFSVAATPTDPDATVEWAHAIGTGDPVVWAEPTTDTDPDTDWGNASPILFEDENSVLFIRVTSANGQHFLYYAITINQFAFATILYGRPTITEGVLDDLWTELDHHVFNVSRVNLIEMEPNWGNQPHTSATAKIMWDDDGLYVLWDVSFHYGRTLNTAAGGAEHERESVEVFVNERLQNHTTGNFGMQYRVGAGDNARSGDFSSAPAGVNVQGVWDAMESTVTWAKPNDEGYYVVMQIPWVFQGRPHTDEVFGPDNLVISGAEIGLELQLNAATTPGTRDAILTWNGINSQAWQNVASFGKVRLYLQQGANRFTRAQTPNLTVENLANARYEVGGTVTALEVTGDVHAPTGAITYRWYSSTTATGDGTFTGVMESTFTPLTTAEGFTWYWVVVTNTDSAAATGYDVAYVSSPRARIQVVPTGFTPGEFTVPNLPIINLDPVSANFVTVVTIPLPDTFVVTDYTTVTFEIEFLNDQQELVPNTTGFASLRWHSVGGAQIPEQTWNIGSTASHNIPIPAEVLEDGNPADMRIRFDGGTAAPTSLRFIRVNSVVFNP